MYHIICSVSLAPRLLAFNLRILSAFVRQTDLSTDVSSEGTCGRLWVLNFESSRGPGHSSAAPRPRLS